MANATDDQVHKVPTHENATDAVKQGQADAFNNTKEERSNSTNEGASREEIVEDAQETARLNHDVDTEAQPELNQEDGFKNDTSKKAKTATAKSQLDPSGGDKDLQANINRNAKNGDNPEPGTNVSNEENARRAAEHNVPSDAPDGSGPAGDDGEPTGATEDASGNPTLGNGETNVPASKEVTALGDGNAKAKSSSADKS